jgi:hypothetical protein
MRLKGVVPRMFYTQTLRLTEQEMRQLVCFYHDCLVCNSCCFTCYKGHVGASSAIRYALRQVFPGFEHKPKRFRSQLYEIFNLYMLKPITLLKVQVYGHNEYDRPIYCDSWADMKEVLQDEVDICLYEGTRFNVLLPPRWSFSVSFETRTRYEYQHYLANEAIHSDE